MNAKAVLTAAAAKVAASLDGRGFERRGLKFIRRRGGDAFVSLIELQRSRSSTSEHVSFAVNFGVVVPSLIATGDTAEPEYGGCHWSGRVCGADGVEIWWPVRANEDPGELAARVKVLLEENVLPALEAKQRDDDLIAFWKTGRSPGLVEAQRLSFLAKLLHNAGRREEFEEVKAELERKATDSFSRRALGELEKLDERS